MAVLAIDELLAPVSEDAPTGADLRELDDGDAFGYQELRDAQRSARRLERSLQSMDPASPEASAAQSEAAGNWDHICAAVPEIIATKSKDLQLCAWLTEALLRVEGMAGLAIGLQLCHRMVQEHWDDVYPKPDADDPAVRTDILQNLLDSAPAIVNPMRWFLVTDSSGGTFAYWEYIQASTTPSNMSEEDRKKRLDEIQQAANSTDSGYYRDILTACEEAIAAVEGISSFTIEKMGAAEAPSTKAASEALDAFARAIRNLGGSRLQEASDAGNPSEAQETASAESGPTTGVSGNVSAPALSSARTPAAAAATAPVVQIGAINSRESAFAALKDVAEFFRQTEPHSIIPYTLDEVVRRGNLNMMELLAELIPDQNARTMFLTKAGIEPSDDDEGSGRGERRSKRSRDRDRSENKDDES